MKSLIDEHVSEPQLQKAVDALLKFSATKKAKSDEEDLLGAVEEHIWLVLAVKKTHPEKKLKPFAIPLKHPVYDPRTTSICLITKDPQREYKDLLEAKGIKFISRVVGIQKLRGKFKPYEPRRQLMREHGMFLADERVVPLLPALLGKIFFDAKKQPVPVCLTAKDLKAELERAVSSSYMHQNQGTCTSIKVATTAHNAKQVLANLVSAVPSVISHVNGGWENVQSLHIKTNSSVSLPLWTCSLDDRWTGLVENTDGENLEMEAEEVVQQKGGAGKGKAVAAKPETNKKRAAEPAPESSDPPKKRKKISADPVLDPSPSSAPAPTKSKGKDTASSSKKLKSDAPVPSTSTSATPAIPAASKSKAPAKPVPEVVKEADPQPSKVTKRKTRADVTEAEAKKTKKAKDVEEMKEDEEPEAPKTTKAPEVEPISSKKEKKGKKVIIVAPEEEEVKEVGEEKPKRKKKAAKEDVAMDEEEPVPAPKQKKKAKEGGKEPEAAAEVKPKRSKVAAAAPPEEAEPVPAAAPSTKASVTVAEVKQKRKGEGLEKKKEKAGKIRSAKDAKAKIVGRGPQ